MRFDILTLFPEAFESFLHTSIIGRAVKEKKIEINTFNIRDFSKDKHKKVDDVPFGGGAGMVMACQPLFDCINHVKKLKRDKAPVIFFTPHGETFRQEMAENFIETKTCPGLRSGNSSRLILLCGHYEGIDERVREALVTQEISLGNFVLTGGELVAQVFIDALSRLIPGVLGADESSEEESFSKKLDRCIEYPHYTRPAEFQGMKVPEVLLSGHHKKIEEWRMKEVREIES